jgi:hypothetical protein
MNMKIITCALVSIVLILLCSAASLTQSISAPIKVSELKGKTFNVDGLDITIKRLNTGYLEIQLENVTSEPITFQPNRLAIVGDDKVQSNILFENIRVNRQLGPTEIMIVPGAKLVREYYLSGSGFKYPARIFYGKLQLAEVTK